MNDKTQVRLYRPLMMDQIAHFLRDQIDDRCERIDACQATGTQYIIGLSEELGTLREMLALIKVQP